MELKRGFYYVYIGKDLKYEGRPSLNNGVIYRQRSDSNYLMPEKDSTGIYCSVLHDTRTEECVDANVRLATHQESDRYRMNNGPIHMESISISQAAKEMQYDNQGRIFTDTGILASVHNHWRETNQVGIPPHYFNDHTRNRKEEEMMDRMRAEPIVFHSSVGSDAEMKDIRESFEKFQQRNQALHFDSGSGETNFISTNSPKLGRVISHELKIKIKTQSKNGKIVQSINQ